MTRPPRYTRRQALALATGAVAAACAGEPRLDPAFDGPEPLLQAVVDRLAARDRRALEALALTEREFRRLVWPSLPAARPERNLPFSYVWGDLHQKSQASLTGVLGRHGGLRQTVAGVAFDGDATTYASVVVHRGTLVRVRAASGEERALRICGSLVEQGGRWKVFSYVVDE